MAVDLGVQRGDDRDLAGDDGGIGVLQHRRLAQLLGPQHLTQLFGAVLDVTAPGTSQGGADRRKAQPGVPDARVMGEVPA